MSRGGVLAWQVLAAAVLLGAWEAAGRLGDATWISEPSLIAGRLAYWAVDDLAVHVGTTLEEMALGLLVGVPLGVFTGLALSQTPVLASLLRPFIVVLYSVPLVTLAPVLILWMGLDLEPKIFLVAALRQLGAAPQETFRKLLLPGLHRLDHRRAARGAPLRDHRRHGRRDARVPARRGLLADAGGRADRHDRALRGARRTHGPGRRHRAAGTDRLERRLLRWRAVAA